MALELNIQFSDIPDTNEIHEKLAGAKIRMIKEQIQEAVNRGEHIIVLENDMTNSLKLQVYGYLSDAGFKVRELFMGDSFEIKW